MCAQSFGEVFVNALLNIFKSELFIVFVILAVGYLLGRITIKGVSLGSSGVFIIALVVGVLIAKFGWDISTKGITGYIKNLGLAMFVTSIGLISGPTFLRNFKKKGLSYVTIGAVIIVVGTIVCIIMVALDPNLDPATGVGLLMGALTSTPGLSSAQNVFDEALKGKIAAASGLAYPFGVLGVVLFIQLMPKILRRDMNEEVAKLKALLSANSKNQKAVVNEEGDIIEVKETKKLFSLDSYGICVFAIAVALGMIVGAITFKLGSSAKFSLGTTGGTIIVGLLLGHFGKIGKISLNVPVSTLKPFREFGLVLFLTGSGIEGGLEFLNVFQPIHLLYGVIMTMVPMIVGFIVARYVFKLELLNNLGSICGGMTSTPALGALIHVSGTDDVAQAYAATYPIALFLLVFVPQIINALPFA